MIGSLAEGRFNVLKRLDSSTQPATLVYLVEDTKERRERRLLRLLAPVRDAGERKQAHFQRELEALAALQHSNLQKIIDFGVTDVALAGLEGTYLYIAGEHVDGPDVLRFAARASWALFMEIAVQALRGLEFLHGQGLLHGALTPENLLIAGRGPRKTAKLLHFGLAAKGLLDPLANPRFLAPEVLGGETADRRADLYSLGAILYEAATRQPILPGKTREELLAAGSPPAPREIKKAIPKAVEDLILTLTARDPAGRPASANAVIRELNKTAHKRFSVETKEAKVATVLTPRFLGRDDEIADLEAIAGRVLTETESHEQDDPVLIALSGEVGVGKTRLLRELKTRLHSRANAAGGAARKEPPTFVEARATEGGPSAILELVHGAIAAAGEDHEDDLLRIAAPLGRLRPDLGVTPPAPLAPEDERLRVTDAAVRTLLACARLKPLVLVLEDAHDADALSLDALRLLVHDVRAARARKNGGEPLEDTPPPPEDAPILVLLSLCHDELPGRPVERAIRDLRQQDGVREVALERLSRDTIEAVAASALGRELAQVRSLVSRVAEVADGSPLIAEEILATLADDGNLPPPDGAFKLDPAAVAALDMPGDLDELARRRLGRLPDDARALVHALALSPAPREARALAQALELDEAEVLGLGRELERRRLTGPPVRTGDDEDSPWRLSLESAALRDAALADLGPDEVEAIDDALGRALAAQAAAAEEDGDEGVAYLAAEDAARHLLRGSRRTSGIPFALAVAGWLAQAAVPERADDILSRALAALDEATRRGEIQAGEPLDAARALEDVPAPGIVKKVAASDLELALLLERGDVLLRAGRPQDARGELERALGIARARRRPREAVTALLGAGRAAQALGDRIKARGRFEEALGLARDVDWPRGIALAQRELGLARLELGDIEDAVAALEAAVRLEEERQDKVALAQALRDLSRALEEKGDLEAAIERASRARDLDEESERPSGVSAAYRRLASIHLQKGDHDRALELARRAIALAREAGDPRGARVALTSVAQVLATKGENDEAIARYEGALRLALRGGDAEGAAVTRAQLARVLEARGRFDEAHSHLEAAIKLFTQLKRRTAAARATVHLARSHLRRGDVTRARDAVERATQEQAAPGTGGERPEGASGHTPVALEALHLRAEIAFRQGDLARAEELAREAADAAARTAQKRLEASARITLGAVRLRRGRLAEAEKEHREARALAQALGDRSLEARARLALARVHLVRAEPIGALEEFEAARDMAQTLGEVDLEVRSLLGLARLHVFLGQPRRAEQILEPARLRVAEVGLGLVRPEVTLAKVEASQESRLIEAASGKDGKAPADKAGAAARAAELAQVDALLDEADRDARATSRRGLRAEVDLARAREELIRGNATAARERAEAALEAARISGDVLLATSAELLVGEARLAGNRVDEARASAERAIAEAEQGGLVEASAQALLLRARTLAAQEAPRAAAKDLREAASLVRAAWAALPENLREAYGRKPLARAIRQFADEVVSRTAAANPRAAAPEPVAVGARVAGTTVAAPSAPARGSAPGSVPVAGRPPAPGLPSSVLPPREEGESAAGAPGQVSLDTLKDPLTGLYNHTYFTAQLEVEIKRSSRHSRPLSLLKINIDRFKLVRELYGPRTGKRIIREVAAVLVRNLRDVDVIARYFGDEFEALLPDTPAAGSVLTADRLRTAIEQTAFAHEGEKVDLTISVGVATFPADAKDKDALTCRVDEALYNARARGPNKTFGFSTKEDPKEAGAEAPDKDLREIDSLMLSREGRLVLSVVNRVVHSELDLDKLIAFTTGMVVDATRGERGFFLLKGRDGELHFKHGRNIEDKELQNPEFKISHGIAREVARTGESILVEEALDDGRFRDFKSVMDLRLRSILCAPIKTANEKGPGEVIGVFYIDHNSLARHFTKEDLHFLEAIATKIAIPLKNSKNLRDAEEQLDEARAKLKTSQDQLETKYRYDKIIGATEPMQRIFKLLDRIVETHHSVVIHGESGTGKELIARAIHYNGPRKNKPFVAENCAALTDTLLEAELFGHVKGAFTGADKDSKGLFELANGGTLFLDEIGDMSERMQKKLLRVLQEGEVRPVGGKKIIKVDVRIISASNKDLKKLVQERKFREDLYYRLNVITVNLPALRERRDDIPLLVEHFHKKVSGEVVKPIDREVMKLLTAYDWPGNVRELENEMNRMVAMSDASIDAQALSPKIREGAARADPAKLKEDGLAKYYDRPLKEVEFDVMKDIILRTLERTNWHRTKAAKILRVPTSTLFNKMKKYGIG